MSVIEPDENELGDGLPDLERRRHSAGVQRGMRVAAERGFYTLSRAPYGYRKNRRQRPRHHTLQVGAGPSDRGNGADNLRRPPAGHHATGNRATTERERHPVAHKAPVDHSPSAEHLEERSLLRHHRGQQTRHERPRYRGQGAERVPGDNPPRRLRHSAADEVTAH